MFSNMIKHWAKKKKKSNKHLKKGIQTTVFIHFLVCLKLYVANSICAMIIYVFTQRKSWFSIRKLFNQQTSSWTFSNVQNLHKRRKYCDQVQIHEHLNYQIYSSSFLNWLALSSASIVKRILLLIKKMKRAFDHLKF